MAMCGIIRGAAIQNANPSSVSSKNEFASFSDSADYFSVYYIF
jgi:hypothetical protein